MNATLALALAAVAVTPVGAPGTVAEGVSVGVEPELEELPPPQAASSKQVRTVAAFFMASTLLRIDGLSVEATNALQRLRKAGALDG
jgi:hypothetical protein